MHPVLYALNQSHTHPVHCNIILYYSGMSYLCAGHRHVEVDDVRDAFDVKTTGSDVSCNDHTHLGVIALIISLVISCYVS